MRGIANYYKNATRKYKAGNSNKPAFIPIGMTKTARDPIFLLPKMEDNKRRSVITVRINSETIRRRPYRTVPFTTC